MDRPVKPAEGWPEAGLEAVPACPLCGGENRREELRGLEDRLLGIAPGRWTLYRCLQCRCAYLDPRPDRATIGLAYLDYYKHPSIRNEPGERFMARLRLRLANSFRNRFFGTSLRPSVPAGWILASLARRKAHSLRLDCRGLDIVGAARGKLLDVGCGTGTFLRFARDAGWQCFGVEPDADAVWTAQAGGATILGSQLAELRGTYAGCFDVVTLSHVIEHVHDPRAVLRDCWSVLKAGGFLWIETPNVDSIGFETYRGAWRGLEPPRHLILFGSESLTGCLSSAGFERIRVLAPRDAVGYTFPRSALVRAGQLGEAGPNALSKADIRRLRLEMRSARRLVDKAPGRSEYITAVAHRPTAAPLGSGST